MHKAERALFELRRGRALYVTHDPDGTGHGSAGALVAPVEGLGAGTLAELRRLSGATPRLLVNRHRARAMGLDGEGRGLSLELGEAHAGPGRILALASAAPAPAGPIGVRPLTPAEAAGLALARLGRILPALVSAQVRGAPEAALRDALAGGAVLDVAAAQIEEMVRKPGVEVTHVSEARVPLEETEDARFMFFSETNGLLEHVAILIGERERWPDPVPVRLHSACLTGDLFGSLRCDCGAQLRGSLRHFVEQGGGVLLYLAQEGRGIGLGNKFRAYGLQQEGLDTVDADGALGFGADERRYDAGIAILKQLGIARVQLLTNNPEKVRALEEGGIAVVHRQPLHGTLNAHNLPYVRAKVQRAGHWLADMLAQPVPGD